MPIGGGGGGGGSSDVRAGGAYVQIYGRDELTKQLEGIKAKASGLTSSIGKTLGGLGIGFGLAEVGKVAMAAVADMNEFNASMKESARITDSLEAAQNRLREAMWAKVGGKLAAPVSQVPEGDKLAFLNREAEEAKRNLGEVEKEINRVIEVRKRLNSKEFYGHELFPGGSSAMEKAQAKVEAKLAALGKQRDGLQSLARELADTKAGLTAKPAALRDDYVKGLAEATRELQIQKDTLYMTAQEAAIYRKHMKAVEEGIAATGGDYDAFRKAMKGLADESSFKSLTDDAKAFNDELDFALKTVGKTAEEIRLMKLEAKADALGTNVEKGFGEKIKKLKELQGPQLPSLDNIGVSGSFGGGNLQQTLGLGSKWQQKIAENGKEAVKQLEKVNENLAGLKVQGLNMVFK